MKMKNKFDLAVFASLMQYTRNDMELSIRKAAKSIGISASTLSRIEAGKITPDLESYYKCCKWANYSTDYFFIDPIKGYCKECNENGIRSENKGDVIKHSSCNCGKEKPFIEPTFNKSEREDLIRLINLYQLQGIALMDVDDWFYLVFKTGSFTPRSRYEQMKNVIAGIFYGKTIY